jgi:outer membrane protein assembly factor BamB
MHTSFRYLLLAASFTTVNVLASDWPQWQGPSRDGVWPEKEIATTLPANGPKVMWRAPVGLGYSGPAVAGSHVYVADYVKKSGEVTANPGGRSTLEGQERLRCFDAATGAQVWAHQWDQKIDLSFPNGPRTTPAAADGKVVILGAEGKLVCCNAKDGKLAWEHDLKVAGGFSESPIWGFSSHPLIHKGVVYVNAGGASGIALAFSLSDGKPLWNALPCKQPGYAPPTILEIEGQPQLVVFYPKGLAGLDLATGKVQWNSPFDATYDMSIMQPVQNNGVIMVSGIVKKNMGVKATKSSSEIVWSQVNRSFNAKNGSPIALDDAFVGCDADGELKCVKAATGEPIWSDDKAINGKKGNSGTFFMARVADTHRFVVFNEKGELVLGEIHTTTENGWKETARAPLLKPTTPQMSNGTVVWSAPAFANQSVYARNDEELVCASLAP